MKTKRFSKVLSVILALSMLLSCLTVAFATAPYDVEGEDCETAVDVLTSLGIVNGYEDGTFKPDRTVTRGEMAKLLMTALGYEELAEGMTSDFTDVKGHWAEGYIALAEGLDIINGYPDGTAKPDAQVSADEAVTMLIRGLGYTDKALVGTWPTNYKIKALNIGLMEDIKDKSEANRGNVALMIYNALEADTVTVDDEGAATSDGNILLDKVGVASEITLSYSDVVGDDAIESQIDLYDYMFHKVEMYENDDEEIVVISDVLTEELVGTVTTASAITLIIEDEDEDEYEVDVEDVKLVFNGTEASDTDFADLVDAEVRVVYEGDDADDMDEVFGVVAEKATSIVVIDDVYDDDDTDIDGIQLPVVLDDDDDEIVDEDDLTIEGDASRLSSIKEDDVVYVYASDDERVDGKDYPEKVRLVVVRETESGTLSEIEDDEVVVGGESFDYSKDMKASKFDEDDLGDEYKVLLDKDGDIFDYELVSEDEEFDGNFAVVIGIAEGTSTVEFGEEEIDDYPRIKMLCADGDVEIFDIFVDIEDDDFAEGFTWTTNTLPEGYEKGDFVTYEINDDDQLDEISMAIDDDKLDVYEMDEDSSYDEPILKGSFITDSSTLVFDITDSDYDEWEVGSESLIGDVVQGVVVFDDNDAEVVVLDYNYGSTSTDDGTYGLVTKVVSAIDPDDEVSKKVTILVDGDEMVYFTEDADDDVETNVLIEVELEDGKLINTDTVDADVDLGEVESIVGNLIRVDGKFKAVADEAVVYEFVYDKDGDLEIEVADYGDIEEEDYVEMYETCDDDDDNDGMDIIFFLTEKSYDNMK